MESWGSHLLNYDDPEETDLLGHLRPWLYDKGDYFPFSLAAQNGTYPTLEALLLDSPISPLMQSNHGYKTYESSRVLPYKKNGYKTIFLTAGPRAWRQLDPTLLTQGFDEIHDAISIKDKFPQAETHTWGVDDEWMFLYALDLLEQAEAQGEKVFLFMLSVTNHPPHRVPHTYTPLPLNLDTIQKDSASAEAVTRSILETYQYANHALGGFLNQLEHTDLIRKSIIAATGDHPNRTIFNYSGNAQLQHKYGVPNSAGRNLFSSAPPYPPFALSYNNNALSLSDVGAVVNPLEPTFLVWQEGELYPTESPGPELLAQARRTAACYAWSDWRIRSQALGRQ